MSVRLEQLLANATPGPWRVNRKQGRANYLPIVADERRLVVMPRADDAALIAKTPDMARLLIDMGEELRGANGTRYGTVDIPQWSVDALLARLDALGKDSA